MTYNNSNEKLKEVTSEGAGLVMVRLDVKVDPTLVEILPASGSTTFKAYIRGPRSATDPTEATTTGFSQIKLNDSLDAQASVEPFWLSPGSPYLLTVEFLGDGGTLVTS
jgi:hypothetical protein